MSKYNIDFFDVDKGIPSATMADYGITLNTAAADLLSGWKYARLGLDREKNIVVVAPHNNDEAVSGSIAIGSRAKDQPYLRINSKDFLRLVAHQCNVALKPSFRCLARWDDEESLLLIELNSVLESKKPSHKRKS